MKKKQLFFLHFAGGSCYSFDFIKPYLPEFDIVQLELPGRGRRMSEILITDFDEAALDLFQQILKHLISDDFLIFGHSMGAYLGLRIVRMLEMAKKPVRCLVVGGNPGPGIDIPVKRHLLNGEEFRIELKNIGGVPEEVLENDEFFSFYEPILRADFKISEEVDLTEEPAINAPLYAMMGNEEQQVDEITNWRRFTKNAFRSKIFDGNHFFIQPHAADIARILKHCMTVEPKGFASVQ